MADPSIQLGRAYLQLFFEMLTPRVAANRGVALVPDQQSDVFFWDTQTGHHLDVFSLLIGRLKRRPSSSSHNAPIHFLICISEASLHTGNHLLNRPRTGISSSWRSAHRKQLRPGWLSPFGHPRNALKPIYAFSMIVRFSQGIER
jgi:hypothetical protein